MKVPKYRERRERRSDSTDEITVTKLVKEFVEDVCHLAEVRGGEAHFRALLVYEDARSETL